jgi:hypothetical protein
VQLFGKPTAIKRFVIRAYSQSINPAKHFVISDAQEPQAVTTDFRFSQIPSHVYRDLLALCHSALVADEEWEKMELNC